MRSLGVISVPNPSTAPCARADLLDRLGGIAAERVWSAPAPGTATEDDLLHANDREGRLCELVDGVLVEYESPRNSTLLRGGDMLSGATVLPGFSLSPRELFAELDRQGDNPGATHP